MYEKMNKCFTLRYRVDPETTITIAADDRNFPAMSARMIVQGKDEHPLRWVCQKGIPSDSSENKVKASRCLIRRLQSFTTREHPTRDWIWATRIVEALNRRKWPSVKD